jgi:hypothetical protein
MSALAEREAAAVSDALRAIAECLRHLACGYGLMAAERAAAIAILAAGIPGTDAAALAAAAKILRSSRRLSSRRRDEASALSLRFAAATETLDTRS